MAKILINVTHGPEHPTRAALGFMIARCAIEEGHTVTVFLAGDAVQLLRDAVLDDLVGLGTGRLRGSYDIIAAGGGRFFLSILSSGARGITSADLVGKPAELVMPKAPVHFSPEHDRAFTYLAVAPGLPANKKATQWVALNFRSGCLRWTAARGHSLGRIVTFR